MDLNINVKVTIDESPALMRSFMVLSNLLDQVKFADDLNKAVQGTMTALPAEEPKAAEPAAPATPAKPEPAAPAPKEKKSHKKAAEDSKAEPAAKPEPAPKKEPVKADDAKSINENLADDMVFASIVKNICMTDASKALSKVVKDKLEALGIKRIKEVPADQRRAFLQEVESHAK